MEGLQRQRVRRASAQPATTSTPYTHCVPFSLPSHGIIKISPEQTVTLTANAVFQPECTSAVRTADNSDTGGITSITDMRDPFHASITPQAYATGAATVIAWMLVIMLLITPRTFFIGGSQPRSGLMGRRGMISGASGGGSIIGVGTRPWLQKVAALTVAISLTLATADTFRIAEEQYLEGFSDATALRDEVVSGMEIKVSRIISDVFLWLAQVQTLIRLFPRHKEKVIIKWIGFALIVLDITFSSLNSFGPYDDSGRPRHFETAVPALSYLFQLALSMLYAAWVMYYALTKRRYAFYHSMMWNITLIALLSFVAILTPVVFFITDISNYSIAGWGDYFRWVGAAAASVIVWEWVERIEALEREERKDGILGREIYDGDEMLEATPSQEVYWPRSQRESHSKDLGKPEKPKKPSDDKNGGGAFTSGTASHGFSHLAQRLSRSRVQANPEETKRRSINAILTQPALAYRRSASQQRGGPNARDFVPLRSPPPAVGSPVSRTDTTSAESTVYTIRYHPISETPPAAPPPVPRDIQQGRTASRGQVQGNSSLAGDVCPEKAIEKTTNDRESSPQRNRWHWQAVANPFKRRGRSPPPEVQRGRVIEPLGVEDISASIPQRNYTGWALKDRLGTFAAQQGEKFRKPKDIDQTDMNLPVTIIPAQPRGRTWSPNILEQAQSEGSSPQNIVGPQVPVVPPRSVPVHAVANSSSTRDSVVQFTPESFQRPLQRHSIAGDEQTTQPVVEVGVEQSEPTFGLTVTSPPSAEPSAGGSSLPSSSPPPPPTNHDR